MDPDQVNPQPEFVRVRIKGKDLTVRQRRDVVSRLLWELKDHGPTMKFPKGVVTAVASEFRVSHDTIRRVWKRAVENFNDPDVKQFCASPQKINNCGRPHKWNRDELREAVKAVPSNHQKTIRSLACALGIPKSTLFAMKSDRENNAVILPVSTAARPLLNESDINNNNNNNNNDNDNTAGEETDGND